jgi:hypothetical protein
MANIIDEYELAGLREDFDNLLGKYDFGGGTDDIDRAKTLVSITRVTSKGTLNETTGLYEGATSDVIYTGPAHFSPVTFRRDRQEIGGQTAIRIRQYRAVLPWDSGDIHLNDLFTVNFTTDPELDGRTFDVTDVMYESELSARRITLTDTSVDADPNC